MNQELQCSFMRVSGWEDLVSNGERKVEQNGK